MSIAEKILRAKADYDSVYESGYSEGKDDYIAELLPYNQNLQVAVKGYASGSTDKEVMEQATSDINAIEAKIEEKGVSLPMLTPSSAYPEKIEEVYEKGYEKGKTESDYNTAFEEGKKAQEREWNDRYQANGIRLGYNYAYAGEGWDDITFNPTQDIEPTSASHIFSATRITDLKSKLEKLGRKLDMSQCISLPYFCYGGALTRIPLLDVSKITDLQYFIYNCPDLVYIEKIILNSEGNQKLANTTLGICPNLVEVRFEGVIGQNGLNVQWSKKLSKASWQSIIGCYAVDLTISMTGSLASVNSAFETSKGANDGSTSAEWLSLIATRPNVAFNLV